MNYSAVVKATATNEIESVKIAQVCLTGKSPSQTGRHFNWTHPESDSFFYRLYSGPKACKTMTW